MNASTPSSDHAGSGALTVLIPAYNEAGMIEQNLASIYDHVCRLASTRAGIRRIRHSVNQGLGQALRAGFAAARGDYVVVMDADLSYDTSHIARLLDALIDNGAQIAVVSPYMRGGRVTGVPRHRALLSRWANTFLAFFCPHADVRTLTSMVRAYDRSFLEGLNLRAVGVDINTEILYKALLLRGRIIEVPAHLDWTLQNQEGIGRVSSFKVVRSVVAYVLAGFIFRPFMFFVVPGLVLALIAAYVTGWTAWSVISVYDSAPAHPYFEGRLSAALAEVFRARPHSFFLGGFSAMIALQLLSLGFIAYQSKRYFEELFHLSSWIRSRVKVPAEDCGSMEFCRTEPAHPSTVAGSDGPDRS